MSAPRSKKILCATTLLLALGWLTVFFYVKSKPNGDPPLDTLKGSGEAANQEAAIGLGNYHQRLLTAKSVTDTKAALKELKRHLHSLPADQAAVIITGYLDSGQDALTQLPFKLGKGGILETPPTLRVALLEIIAEISPRAAAKTGRTILENPTSPDEWAIALRNVANSTPDSLDTDYLRKKAEELINNPEWQANPSTGYFEAFDVLVHTKSTTSTPLLSKLIRTKDRRDLNHAAFVTLDRLTQKDRPEMIRQLTQDTKLHKSHPTMVAQQIARADLRDMKQCNFVETWIISPARTPDEIQAFCSIFPNHNQMVSNNLLTNTHSPKEQEFQNSDRIALAVLKLWAANPNMQHALPYFKESIARLKLFTENTTTAK